MKVVKELGLEKMQLDSKEHQLWIISGDLLLLLLQLQHGIRSYHHPFWRLLVNVKVSCTRTCILWGTWEDLLEDHLLLKSNQQLGERGQHLWRSGNKLEAQFVNSWLGSLSMNEEPSDHLDTLLSLSFFIWNAYYTCGLFNRPVQFFWINASSSTGNLGPKFKCIPIFIEFGPHLTMSLKPRRSLVWLGLVLYLGPS